MGIAHRVKVISINKLMNVYVIIVRWESSVELQLDVPTDISQIKRVEPLKLEPLLNWAPKQQMFQ